MKSPLRALPGLSLSGFKFLQNPDSQSPSTYIPSHPPSSQSSITDISNLDKQKNRGEKDDQDSPTSLTLVLRLFLIETECLGLEVGWGE